MAELQAGAGWEGGIYTCCVSGSEYFEMALEKPLENGGLISWLR